MKSVRTRGWFRPITLTLENEVNIRRLEAVPAHSRASIVLNRHNGATARIGILSAGKPYYDLRQALRDWSAGRHSNRQGGDAVPARSRSSSSNFAEGLETILVVEEKRSFLELQLREMLYDLPARPGGARANRHLPPTGELDPDKIAKVLCEVLERAFPGERIPSRRPGGSVTAFMGLAPQLSAPVARITAPRCCWKGRSPAAASGATRWRCVSTTLSATFAFHDPYGRRRRALDRHGAVRRPVRTFFRTSAMAPCSTPVSSPSKPASRRRSNITYRILYNGHVAMTGGQNAVGALPIPDLTRKLEAEGVRKTVVLAEDVEKYAEAGELASNAELRSRDELPRRCAKWRRFPASRPSSTTRSAPPKSAASGRAGCSRSRRCAW